MFIRMVDNEGKENNFRQTRKEWKNLIKEFLDKGYIYMTVIQETDEFKNNLCFYNSAKRSVYNNGFYEKVRVACGKGSVAIIKKR